MIRRTLGRILAGAILSAAIGAAGGSALAAVRPGPVPVTLPADRGPVTVGSVTFRDSVVDVSLVDLSHRP